MPKWAETAINMASPRLGTAAVRCSDDFFAPMARMLADATPVFKPEVFDDNGKWMDGWESRRRRDGGHDWCVIKLGVRATIRGVDIDTAHFTGNYPPRASLWAADGDQEPGESDWYELIATTDLGSSAHHFLPVEQPDSGKPWRWLRLNIFPDGGVARLRVYGDPVPAWHDDKSEIVELSAIKNGGRVIGYNDAHYGDVWAILTAGRGATMGDGWETRRRREPGHDWIIIELGAAGTVERVEVDTAHFKGNYPDRCSLRAALIDTTVSDPTAQAETWPELMSEQPLSADTIHNFDESALESLGPVSHVKLNIHPDGGISRLRIWGRRA
jgi:allantoicase